MKEIDESVPKFEGPEGTLLPGACFQIENLLCHHFLDYILYHHFSGLSQRDISITANC